MAQKVTNSRFVFFTDPSLKGEINEGMKLGLSRWGAYIRRTARQSIKERKGPSKPGFPPHSHEGSLKRLLNFYYDRVSKTVVVGPEIKSVRPTGAPNILEFGGAVKQDAVVTQRVFKVGDKGPIKVKENSPTSKKLVWIKLKTQKQCERATRIYNEQQKKKRVALNFKIAPRPYMYPAMMKNLHVAPKNFKATLKGK